VAIAWESAPFGVVQIDPTGVRAAPIEAEQRNDPLNAIRV